MTRAAAFFTRDARLHDDVASSAGSRSRSQIVPLLALDDALRNEPAPPVVKVFCRARPPTCARREESAADTSSSAAATNPRTSRLAHRAAATVVFVGADASTFARRRQERLARGCRPQRTELRVQYTYRGGAGGEPAPGPRRLDHCVATPPCRRLRDQPSPTRPIRRGV